MNQLRDAERAASIAGSGLNPDVLERTFAEQAPVANAVERDAAGKTEIVRARHLLRRLCHAQHDFLGHHLHRPREVHLLLRQIRLGHARRAAEQLVEGLTRHREAAQIIEVLLIERERAILAQLHQVLVDQVDVFRLTVRRQAHHLVLAGVDLESGVVRDGRVEQAERIRPAKLAQEVEVRALAVSDRRRGPFANAIHGENGRFLEWGRVERARRMGLVMLRVEERALVVAE